MPKGKLLKIAHENEQGLLELKLMNEDPKNEIERVLGMQDDKKKDMKTKTGPKLLPGTRTIARDPVGPAAAA